MNLRIREFRDMMGLTQKEFARKIKKSIGTVQSWEGGVSYPNAEAICVMCEFFGVDPNTLLGWYDEHPEDATKGLSKDESILLSDYRSCTPSRKSKAAEAVRDQRDLSEERAAASPQREAGAA